MYFSPPFNWDDKCIENAYLFCTKYLVLHISAVQTTLACPQQYPSTVQGGPCGRGQAFVVIEIKVARAQEANIVAEF